MKLYGIAYAYFFIYSYFEWALRHFYRGGCYILPNVSNLYYLLTDLLFELTQSRESTHKQVNTQDKVVYRHAEQTKCSENTS